jgi:hypothetical protein
VIQVGFAGRYLIRTGFYSASSPAKNKGPGVTSPPTSKNKGKGKGKDVASPDVSMEDDEDEDDDDEEEYEIDEVGEITPIPSWSYNPLAFSDLYAALSSCRLSYPIF